MKKNGFTLLELLIGLTLISVVMIFLFRLINDVQNEGLSNTYIIANQTNRDEIISKVSRIIHDNGYVSKIVFVKGQETYINITFQNNKQLDITVNRSYLHIHFDSKDYRYVMKGDNAYYDINATYTTITYDNIQYIKINARTHKKGLKDTTIDDIEFIFPTDSAIISEQEAAGNAVFNYSGSPQLYKVLKTGVYKIELWGAQGGSSSKPGGKGAYTSGTITLNKNDELYFYVGGKPADERRQPGGWNGGGYVATNDDGTGRSGGGATDVRLVAGSWDNEAGLNSRIMVAAGGGGAACEKAAWCSSGGSGGTLTGNIPTDMGSSSAGYHGTPGTQLEGGFSVGTLKSSSGLDRHGYFGKGGHSGSYDDCGSGGSGYYGGGGASYGSGGAGGSSYVSGYPGCIAIKSAYSQSPRDDSNNQPCDENSTDPICSEHYTGRVFANAVMIDGDSSMPTHSGVGTMIGNEGNGYARVTYISAS